MSRGVKDLRDVITVSRLTFRDSDEEIILSDEEEGRISRIFGAIKLGESAASPQALLSFDSGIRNGSSATPEAEVTEAAAVATLVAEPPKNGNCKRRSRNKRRKEAKKLEAAEPKGDPVVREFLRDFPTMMPLPPLTSRPLSSSSESGICTRPGSGDGNFDDLLMHLDMTVVADWLAASNVSVGQMAVWIHTGEHFVRFAHFWLSEFSDTDKLGLFKLEYGIVLDNMQLAFNPGISSGSIKRSDLRLFLEAVFREYPARLMSSFGKHLFLDYLDVLASERQGAYKRLLSDVKCSTRIRQHAQSVLAIRAYALVNVWSSIINFYCHLEEKNAKKGRKTPEETPISLKEISKTFPFLKRMHQAIRLGYLDTVHYLLTTAKVHVNEMDENLQSLIHISVLHSQMSILKYLLFQVDPPPNVNQAASSGNTPLHVAANMGNADIIAILARAGDIDLNPINPSCDDATPLHLASMLGHEPAVAMLLDVGADRNCLMNGHTPLKLAKDFQQQDIIELFEETTDLQDKNKNGGPSL